MAVVLKNLFRKKSRSGSTGPATATKTDSFDERSSPSPKDDIKAFRKALIAGDIAKVTKLLTASPSLVHRPLNNEGQTAIHVVAESGNLELLELLIKFGADVNAEDGDGNAPLVLGMNSMACFQCLLKHKHINVTKRFNGQSLLHHICRRFTTIEDELLRRLIKKGININEVNGAGDTSLHVACMHGHHKMAELLLLNGALPNVQNRKGETPLHIAAQQNNLRLAKIILNYNGAASLFLETHDGHLPKDVASSDEMRDFLISAKRKQRDKTRFNKKMNSSGAIMTRVKPPKRDNGSSTSLPSPREVPRACNSTPQLIPHRRARFGNSESDSSDSEVTSNGRMALSGQYATSVPLKEDYLSNRLSKERSQEELLLRQRSFSFSQAFARLAIMDEEKAVTKNEPTPAHAYALREKLETELLSELSHLVDSNFLIDIIDKVCSSKSFEWSDDLDANKIEILKWIPEFLVDDERQAVLQFLYDNYSSKIAIDVQKDKSPSKKRRGRSQSKLELKERKLKKYEWEIDKSEVQLGDIIGTGSFGIVYRAYWGGRVVALKQFTERLDDEETPSIVKEVALLSHLRHPHIIQFLGACLGDEMWLVMEYAEKGDLRSYLQRNKVDWATKLRLAREIAEGMAYLHAQQPPIVHRDLKCQNILLTADCKVKLSDFGLSKAVGTTVPSKLGTLNWLAPEMLRGEMSYTTKADVYSMGMCCYEILCDGQPPFRDMLPLQIVRAIDEGFRPEIPAGTDEEFAQLLTSCWAEKPDERPTFVEIAERLSAMEKRLRVSK